MMQNHFFDIPVYRIEEKKYCTEIDEYIQRKMYRSPMNKEFLDSNPEHKIRQQAYFIKKFGGEWRYNEIIGWIELYFCGSQIRGEFWQVDVKRIVRSRKKTFEWQTVSCRIVLRDLSRVILRSCTAYSERVSLTTSLCTHLIYADL